MTKFLHFNFFGAKICFSKKLPTHGLRFIGTGEIYSTGVGKNGRDFKSHLQWQSFMAITNETIPHDYATLLRTLGFV